MKIPTFLHVGCGRLTKQNLKGFSNWKEIRLDIDASVYPDVVGSIVDLSGVEKASVDAVFSSHNIEHVYAHEVVPALTSFKKVLNLNGFLLITCPSLEAVCELILSKGLLDTVYESPSGPIAPIDMMYGHRPSVALNPFMAHKCGFTANVLVTCLYEAGFKQVHGGRSNLDLWFIAFNTPQPVERVAQLLEKHIP